MKKGVHMENTGGLRRGTWTPDEDRRLKACIDKYGEGNWHLVSERAGLNRCRKSCRLRWLNYLNPNINRESFSEDEIDLIKRLHNLLGNKWSLIAGRLPGRTSNDVKNYWYTYMKKKVVSEEEKEEDNDQEEEEEEKKEEKFKETMTFHEVIKPIPLRLSSNFGKQLVLTSNHDTETARVPIPNQFATCSSASQPNLGNIPIPCELWSESLWNLGEDVNASCSSLLENNNPEFSNVDNSFLDSNLGDFFSLWDP